jgi:small-conductance mechanosensitive channel
VLLGIGYAGIGLAGLAALSYAGLDFTHLAIVAGALSVGIGFGLQAIFNNFVSGIILLVERPVKVGDWIIVNGREGFVRRINVRATEIETFDRASVIVPNSQLITGEVINLTHRNAMGRVLIKVGASYKADPEQVMRILQGVADKSSSILRLPAPGVGFDDFGPDSMMFSLVAFVADVGQRGAVQNELRIAINTAFREAGIEMPYAQQDIHLRDLDGVKSALAAAMEARRREKDLEASG